MRVIPVIDLLDGVAVHGRGGKREQYRPLISPWIANADPVTVARALVARGFEQVYVADLNALQGRAAQTAVWQAIADSGLSLWLDAGINGHDAAAALVEPVGRRDWLARVIVALESLDGPGQLPGLLQVLGDRAMFSLDLKNGRLHSDREAWCELDFVQAASVAAQAGFRRLLILDVGDVGLGGGSGTAAARCRQVADNQWIELVSGGGVRHADDLQTLADAGCHAALVATALYDGTLM